ncbi:MAG: hypothetical protein GVY08_00465 [Bacteroidetes bacterium]|nr:hypothetical protein [Bacteroidota bacterium]
MSKHKDYSSSVKKLVGFIHIDLSGIMVSQKNKIDPFTRTAAGFTAKQVAVEG